MSVLAPTPADTLRISKMMRRDQRTVSIATSSTVLLGSNPRRKGVVLSLNSDTQSNYTNALQLAGAVDTSTTGIKQSLTVPTGQQIACGAASFICTTGAAVASRLQVVRSATTYTLFAATTSGNYAGSVPLSVGDVIQWNVITAQPASTSDFTISLVRNTGVSRVTVSVQNPAILDQGINLPAGGDPVVLWDELLGDAITEGLYAIAASVATPVTVWDLFS